MAEVSAGPGVEGGGATQVVQAPSADTSASAIGRLETDVAKAKTEAEQRDTATREAATPKPEDKIPSRVAQDKDYKKNWGDLYSMAKTNSPDGNVDTAKIDELALNRHYTDLAEKVQAEGIPQEVVSDPLFQKEYGKVVMDAQKENKPLDRIELERLALKEYQRQKDLQAEVAQDQDDKDKTTPAAKEADAGFDFNDPNKLNAVIDALPLTDEQKARIRQEIAEKNDKNKPKTALEWILIIVGAVIQETAGLVIPRGH